VLSSFGLERAATNRKREKMTSCAPKALLNLTGRLCHQKSWNRGVKWATGSRITKYKNPMVGGIFKPGELPLRPRDDSEYADEGESLYPEVVGEYPPGEWGKMDRERAWRFHERGQELLEIGSLRKRLYDLTKVKVSWTEKYITKETFKYWHIEPTRDLPYFFPFLQYVTKTRLHHTLPAKLLKRDPNVDIDKLTKRVADSARLMEAKGCTAEEKVAAIVEIVNGELLASRRVEHLVEGQLDKNVTFQAAWRRGGFAEDDMDDHVHPRREWNKSFGFYEAVGGYTNPDPGILNFQTRASSFLSLRSEFPLRLDLDDEALTATTPATEMAPHEATDAGAKDVTVAETDVPDVSVSPFVHDWVVHDDNSIPLYAYHPSLHGLQSQVGPPKLDPGYNLQPVFHKTFIFADRDKFWEEKVMTWNAISDRGAVRRIVHHHHQTYHPGVESDPRGFPHTAFVLPVDDAGVDALGYSFGRSGNEEDVDDDDQLQVQQWNAEKMLTTLFTWNLASAYYQGFCPYLELTYPISSQGVITDGDTWQFYVLRTDAMELWRDDDAYLRGSDMWMTRVMKMEEEPDLILSILTNFMARETRREMTGEQLRPYVTKTDEIVQEVKPKYEFEMKIV